MPMYNIFQQTEHSIDDTTNPKIPFNGYSTNHQIEKKLNIKQGADCSIDLFATNFPLREPLREIYKRFTSCS